MAALLPDVIEKLLPMVLAYLRVQSAVLIMPVFCERVLPVRIRVGLAICLAPVAIAFFPREKDIVDVGPPDFFLLAIRELLTGVLIALPARLLALSLHIASSAIGATASLSQLIGTQTEAAPHPIGNLLHLAGLALLMAAGLPLLLIDILAQSYAVFPAGQLIMGQHYVSSLIGLVGKSFVLAMALASPFILGGLLYQLLTGVVNRVMPSLPVVFIGAPAIILMALAGLAILAPSIIDLWAVAVLDSWTGL